MTMSTMSAFQCTPLFISLADICAIDMASLLSFRFATIHVSATAYLFPFMLVLGTYFFGSFQILKLCAAIPLGNTACAALLLGMSGTVVGSASGTSKCLLGS